MTIQDLFFLASVLFCLTTIVSIAISLLRSRFAAASRLARVLSGFVVVYAVVLVAVSIATPRRFFAPGERQCFDDWCIAAVSAAPVAERTCPVGPGRSWVVTFEVSSDARRVRQRARDANAELEDSQGRRYAPCPMASNPLAAELGPGESFRAELPFPLTADAQPAGVVMHHGDFPGQLIIGEDQSFLHPPALHRLLPNRP